MIDENGKHYLYRHIRIDTNEVFYIGIGTKSNRIYNTTVSTYYRAYKKQGKNSIWNKITSKTDYNVQILLESNSYDFIKSKEIEFIKLYGKKTYYGSLCNMTDGGDGTTGTKRHKSKQSKFSKKIYQFDSDGVLLKKWNCGKDIERELNFYSQSIYDCCNKKKKNKTAYGFQWSYSKNKMGKVKINDKNSGIKVHQYTKKLDYIKSYPSALQASIELEISPNSITNCTNGKINCKTAYGFVWSKKILSITEKKKLLKELNTRKAPYSKAYDIQNNEISCNGCGKNEWYRHSKICAKCMKCSSCCFCEHKTPINVNRLFINKKNNGTK